VTAAVLGVGGIVLLGQYFPEYALDNFEYCMEVQGPRVAQCVGEALERVNGS
jgi:hypothetical protein